MKRPSSVVNFSHFNLLLWNHWAKWNQTWQEASMGGLLQSFLISSRSGYKYGRHRQFLFLIGWYSKIFSSETTWTNFVPIGLQIWPIQAILVSDRLIFQKSSPLKPHYTGSIYGRSFTNFPHFILIGQQIWLPQAILVSDWLIFQNSSPRKPHGQM